MNAKKQDRRQAVRWVTKDTVWHARGKRFIVRRDGQPFRFPIFK